MTNKSKEGEIENDFNLKNKNIDNKMNKNVNIIEEN